jgi:hypothetical protein
LAFVVIHGFAFGRVKSKHDITYHYRYSLRSCRNEDGSVIMTDVLIKRESRQEERNKRGIGESVGEEVIKCSRPGEFHI